MKKLSLFIFLVIYLFSCPAKGQDYLKGIGSLVHKVQSDTVYVDTIYGAPRREIKINYYKKGSIVFKIKMISWMNSSWLSELYINDLIMKKKIEYDFGYHKKNIQVNQITEYNDNWGIDKHYMFNFDGSVAYSDGNNIETKSYKKGEYFPDISIVKKFPNFFEHLQICGCKEGYGLEANWDCIGIE